MRKKKVSVRHRVVITWIRFQLWWFMRQWTKKSRRVKQIMKQREDRFGELRADNVRLQAIFNDLSKTADGVPIKDGMLLWEELFHRGGPNKTTCTATLEIRPGDYKTTWYSTREAAESAEATIQKVSE